MNGLLIQDTDKNTSIIEKIDAAAQRYFEKYGAQPNRAVVNAAQLREWAQAHPAEFTGTHGLIVQPSKTVMENYILVGVEAQLQ